MKNAQCDLESSGYVYQRNNGAKKKSTKRTDSNISNKVTEIGVSSSRDKLRSGKNIRLYIVTCMDD
jgi:hypothetical protein